ncbi:hypothetical protein N836_07930 [Leptolyngbya sp. Heron Island J]|nr:hypothetical protein [Leptolyngbya sp. Heron Island J]ESA36261.1 hypothetical protein N836_07930 [Leptolyngbya sp. Heron Island J]
MDLLLFGQLIMLADSNLGVKMPIGWLSFNFSNDLQRLELIA